MQPYSCGKQHMPTMPQLWGWVVVDDKTTATANRNRKAKPQEGFVWLPWEYPKPPRLIVTTINKALGVLSTKGHLLQIGACLCMRRHLAAALTQL